MFNELNEFNQQVSKPWAVYYSVSPGFRYCMTRLSSRADGETYLRNVKRKVPKKFYLELVFDPTNEG